MKKPPLRCRSLPWRDIAWVLISPFLLLNGCDRKAGDPHYVGHVVALTGPDRDRGLAAARGVQLAVEEVNADQNRWVAGRKVAVIHADTRSELDTTAKQAVRLVAVNRVSSLLGGLTRPESDQMAKVAREYSVLTVGTSGTIGTPAVAEAFALGVTPARRARIIGQFLTETLQPARIALIVDGNSPNGGFVETLTRQFHDHKTAFDTATFLKPEEIVALAQSWGASPPTVVFVGSLNDAAKLRNLVEPPPTMIFAGDEVEAHQFVEFTRDENGPYWVGAYVREGLKDMDFANKYSEKFQSFPPVEAMMGYDSARVLFSAAQEVRSFAPTKLSIRFRQPKAFDGLMGPIAFGEDQIGAGPAFVLQATKTGTVMRKRIEPEGTGK